MQEERRVQTDERLALLYKKSFVYAGIHGIVKCGVCAIIFD